MQTARKFSKTHYAVWTEQFTIQLPCVSECADTCGETVDPNIVGDAVLAEFAKRKIIGGQYLTDYVKATKLVSYDTPSGFTNCKLYSSNFNNSWYRWCNCTWESTSSISRES